MFLIIIIACKLRCLPITICNSDMIRERRIASIGLNPDPYPQ